MPSAPEAKESIDSLRNRRWPGLRPEPSPGPAASPVADLLRLQEQFRRVTTPPAAPVPPRTSPVTSGVVGSRPSWQRGASIAVLLLIMAVAAVAIWRAAAPDGPHVHEPSPVREPPPAALPAQAPPSVLPPDPNDPAAFSAALGRLNRALDALPGSPQAILGSIYASHATAGSSVCNFEWAGGQPAIVYGRTANGRSLSKSLNVCADAVEKLRVGR